MKLYRFLIPALLATGLVACSDDDSNDSEHEHEEAIDVHACVHIGDEVAVTASAAEEDAGDVSSDHTGYLVALSSFEGGNGGYLEYAAGEEAEYGFFVDQDVPLQIFDSSGAEIEIEESGDGSGTCSISNYHVADLGVGTYTIVVGGANTSASQLALVIEELEHEHDHEHEGEHDHEHEGEHDHEHEA